jgi:hypothetical protein
MVTNFLIMHRSEMNGAIPLLPLTPAGRGPGKLYPFLLYDIGFIAKFYHQYKILINGARPSNGGAQNALWHAVSI